MKNIFFAKIEERLYFKVTTLFWHILIGIGVFAIVIGIIVVLWNFLPTFKKEVVKQPFPDKEKYPTAVTVSFEEVNSIIKVFEEMKQTKQIKQNEIVQVQTNPQQESAQNNQQITPIVVKDVKGENDFQASIERLKKIIPPENYNKIWESKGFYTFPNVPKYWDKTHNESYRKFNVTEPCLGDRLKALADNYLDRKKLLDGYITAITPLAEESRPEFLKFLISHRENSINKTIALAQVLAKIFPLLQDVKSGEVIQSLIYFNRKNPNDGIPFINYVVTILGKFDSKIRDKIITVLENNYFNNNLQNQIEATDLFLPMLIKFKADVQDIALQEY